MPMQSVGGAFSNAMDQELMKHETAKRQAMLDTLSIQREADLAKYREDEIKIRRDEAAQHIKAAQAAEEERASAREDKNTTKHDKVVSEMVPGDIPSAELIANEQKYHPGSTRFSQPVPSAPVRIPGAQQMPIPGAVGDESGQPVVAGQPLTSAPPEALAAPPQAIYLGSRVDRLAEEQRKRQQDFLDTLPEGDGRKAAIQQALGAEAAGLKVPPGFFEKAPAKKERFQFDPTTGKYFNAKNEQVTDLPDDAVIDRRAEPKDHSVSDAAKTDREARHLDDVHKTAVTELNKRVLPYESHIQTVNDLGTMLNARTPQADALIAPMVLKATVSGAGTGFRMTQSEINQVVGGRSKWESLEAALNKWNSDPTKALSITDEQRTQLRDLAKTIREKATTLTRKATDTRHALDDAKTPQEIHKLMTTLQEDLSKAENEPDASASGSGGADFEYDENGKLVTKPRKK